MKTFNESVRDVVRKIPKGEIKTYREVAIAAGSPSAHRAVANIMAANLDKEIPCHRVIRSDGKIGGYNRGGEDAKRKILESEGVIL
jgi:methylated-DNA-[protein]-cysteine S-methyltransferase